MRVTFIRPNMINARSSDAMEPLAFSILAGNTPTDVGLKLYDDRIEDINYEEDTSLVAITVETFTARRAYQIARKYRAKGIPVVMGGYHASLKTDEVAQHCDSVVVGDAEQIWPDIIEDARQGRLKPIYTQDNRAKQFFTKPQRAIFTGKSYVPMGLVQYGRGCRFTCDFCSIHAFYGSHLSQRPLQDLLAELEQMDKKIYFFVDDNLFSHKKKSVELFTALIPLKIKWACQISIDIARDPQLMSLMEKSGCIAAVIGFESLDENNLKQMNKKWNLRRGDYSEAIKVFHNHGIMIYGAFVFGYDFDTPDVFDISVDFALRSNFFLANFNPLTPTPGSALYDRLQKQNRLIYENWWLDPSYRYGKTIFLPKNMSANQLSEGSYRARCQFYAYNSILRRIWSSTGGITQPYKIGVYLLANIISKREIKRKQDRSFGDADILALERNL